MHKTTLPAVMKMEDLIDGECTFPEKLDHFFKALIGGKDIRHRDGNTLEELETEATISSVNRSQICSPDIIQSPSLCTGVAFDNFDRYVVTLTGKNTLHDTVGIIYKRVSDDYDIEVNSSSISGNLDIPLPQTKEDGLLTRKFQNYVRFIIDSKC
ncbi:hypothetical protein TNCV_3775181 [Trichonephila clavipes]|nr:hypothetical protein TNCV_3775181 [Trichonephila clavipes]